MTPIHFIDRSLSQALDDFSALVDEVLESGVPKSTLPLTLATTKFPPYNIYIEEDGSQVFEFAVAGWKTDEIKINYENDHLILTMEKAEKEDNTKRKYLARTIREGKTIGKYYVPTSKFDTSKTTASLSNGILKVTIPMKEEAKPFSVTING